MMPKPMPTEPIAPNDLLTEVLALRPEIERILADEAGGRNASCIEDKVQIVLFNVAKHLATYEPHAEGMRPWVSRIAYHVKLDARRAKKRRIAAFGYESVNPDEIPHASACPERRARARVFLRKVIPAIETMPEPLRTALVLIAFGRLDHEQVAQKLDISVPAVKMRVLRARSYLREKVGALDEHLAVLAPVPTIEPEKAMSWPRRALTLSAHFVHLWPPFLVGALALSQIEMPMTLTVTGNGSTAQEFPKTSPSSMSVVAQPDKPSTAGPRAVKARTPKVQTTVHVSPKSKRNAIVTKPHIFAEDIAPSDAVIGDGS